MIRKITTEDAEKLLSFIRELVKVDPERVETMKFAQKMTISDEVSWIETLLKKERQGNMITRCYEMNGKIAVLAHVQRLPRTIESHMGDIRIGFLPEFFKEAEETGKALITQARNIQIESLIYFHFATQKNGIRLMKELGFVEVGTYKKYYKRISSNGKIQYTDQIHMQKKIISQNVD